MSDLNAGGQGTGAAAGGTPPPVGTGGGTPPPSTGTPPGATGTPPAGGTPPPAAANWYDAFPEEDRGYVQLKGWKDPRSVVDSYRNAEKLLGAPKDQLLRLPENLSDPKALEPIFQKLGRPDKADGYDVKVPEGGSPEFAKWAQDTFHGLGLTKNQGEALSKAWNDRVVAQMTAQQEGQQAAQVQQVEKLKQEWGAAFDQNTKLAQDFAAAIGFDENHCRELAKSIGVDGVNKLFVGIMSKFGLKLGEHSFHGGEGGTNSFHGQALTPEAAKARITELKSDRDWIKRWSDGGAKEREELHRLTVWSMS